MKRVALTAEMRETGKGPAKRMRAEGRVPAILYGKTVKPLPLYVDRAQVEKIVKGETGMNVMIDLSVKGGDSGLALIRDYQADPFKREFTHIDFQAITMKDKLELEIPIEFVGTSIGVKEGGVLEILRRTAHVKTLPDKIPSSIKVDISELMIGNSVHADELKLPDGVEFPHKVNYTIVSVVPPAKAEDFAPAAAAVPEGEVPVEGAEAVAGAAAAPGTPGAPGAEAAEGKGAPEKKGASEKKAEKKE